MYGWGDGYRRHKCQGCKKDMKTAWWVQPEAFCHACQKRAEEKMGNWYAKVRRGIL